MGRKQHKRARSAKDLARRKEFRRERERVLIVTEGAKTEPAYFRKLIQELGLTTATVSIVGDGGSAPISVLEHAQTLLAQDREFEFIYLVFDRDRHDSYDQAISEANSMAQNRDFKAKTIAVIPSIPCFEIWYLFHQSDSRKPYESAKSGGSPANALIKDLKASALHFKTYRKADCSEFFDTIRPNRPQAKQRAKRALSEAKNEKQPKYHENPSTRVHILVERLEKLSEEQVDR